MSNQLRNVPFSIPAENRERVTEALQDYLTDLLDVALRLKQAHWNLRGPRFLSIHEHLDTILEDVREAVDDVAERAVTLGSPVNGLPAAVAKDSHLDEFPTGVVQVPQTIELVCRDLGAAAANGRKHLSVLAELDPISEDLVIGVVNTIEKHHWMLDAQRERPE